jgi:hypothetical protein
MKRLFPVFFLMMILPTLVSAQDSTTAQSPVPAQPGYGGGDYGRRAELFVTAFGLFTHQATGNAISQDGTNAGGGSAGYRFYLNGSSALEGRYGFSRNSQKYTIDSAVTSIPVYFSEISGSYVYNFLKPRRLHLFAEGGGGLVLFSPTNYGNGSNGYNGGTGYNGTIGYNGSSSSLGRQAKGMFLYGVGADVPASSHVSVRAEFRSLGYKAPDFGLAPLHTDAFSFVYEPSVGVAFRF